MNDNVQGLEKKESNKREERKCADDKKHAQSDNEDSDSGDSNDSDDSDDNLGTRGMAKVKLSSDGKYLMFINPQKHKDEIKCESYHVSCQSDPIPKDKEQFKHASMFGLVIYRYNGNEDWRMTIRSGNTIHCKTGYIVIKNKSNLEGYSGPGRGHGPLFSWFFGDWHSSEHRQIIGGGFSVYEGDYKFNSGVFNDNGSGKLDEFHNNKRGMNEGEAQAIKQALENWRYNGRQNRYVRDMEFTDQNTWQPDVERL